MVGQPLADVGGCDLQQGPIKRNTSAHPLLGHGAQAAQAGAPAQGDEQRLHLVVRMLGQGHGCRAVRGLGKAVQGGVAGNTGGVFGALAGLGVGVNALNGQGHAQALAQLDAMGFKV